MLRGRRDILRNSDVGAIFLSRQSAGASSDRNQVAGVDANFRFMRALSVNGFLTRSFTPGVDGGEMAGKGSVAWNDNFLHTQYSFLTVGDNFRDDIGFIKRTGVRKHFVDFGVRPRPSGCASSGSASCTRTRAYNIYTDQSNQKVSHTNHVAHGMVSSSAAASSSCSGTRASSGSRRRSRCGPISRSRPAATTGTSTSWSWRPITAGRCRGRR